MKNLKKLVFLLIALLAVLALVGCGGGGNNNGTDNNTNGNGNGNTETAQWAAYQLADTVAPSSGASGKIQSFTYICTITTDGEVQQYKIEGANEGMEAVTDNGTSVTCYKVKHRVTVISNETDEEYPDWAETTLWIPVEVPKDSTMGSWLYPKAKYVNSEGDEGGWSYYLTEAMEDEMDNPPAGTSVTYTFAWEGEYYGDGFSDWTYLGLYGWGWSWFKDFAEGGAQELHEGSWGAAAYGYTYDCDKIKKTVGGYTFDAWSLDVKWSSGGDSAGYKGIFSEDLAMPIYWKFGSSTGGADNYWEYEMTDLELD